MHRFTLPAPEGIFALQSFTFGAPACTFCTHTLHALSGLHIGISPREAEQLHLQLLRHGFSCFQLAEANLLFVSLRQLDVVGIVGINAQNREEFCLPLFSRSGVEAHITGTEISLQLLRNQLLELTQTPLPCIA